MKTKHFLLSISITLLLISCTARLKVDVKILKRSYLIDNSIFWKEKLRPLEERARQNLLSGRYEGIARDLKFRLDTSLTGISKRSTAKEKALRPILKTLSAKEKVNVDSLNKNRKYLAATNIELKRISGNKRATKKVNTLMNYSTNLTKKIVTIIQEQQRVKLSIDSIQNLLDKLPPTISIETANSLISAGKAIVDTTINDVIRSHKLGLRKYDNSLSVNSNIPTQDVNSDIEITKILRESVALLNQGFMQLTSLGGYLRLELDKLNDLTKTTSESDFQTSIQNIIVKVDQITKQASATTQPFLSIKGDPLASVVAGAQKHNWQAVANFAKGKTAIGNSDIAIVMEPNGEYTVKGIRNDGTQATKATFAVMNLTVEALAKYSGVSVNNTSPDSATSSDSTESKSTPTIIDKTIQAGSELKITKSKSQAAQLKIFSAILVESKNLSDTTKIEKSISSIKTVFDSSKKILLKQ